ncbi:MAG: hypothetical protein NE334_13620 [Lentisphaeraceae bacterium]|nr:hypothetical protein [Lentisphaeraceae bacterium]
MMFQNGNILELRAGEEAEILSYSTLEIVHLALPHQLKSKTAFEDMGRQIAALQYCTKNKLSEISALNKNVLANMQKEGICLHASHDFGLSKPESVSEDSKAMFKKILKTYLNNQRN